MEGIKSDAETPRPLHAVTPLQNSVEMSRHLNRALEQDGVAGPKCRCWVKLDCTQPGGSFKIRGIGHLAQVAQQNGATKLCSSSGGNAGMATAYAASTIGGLSATVVVPMTTPEFARAKIRALGAEVLVHGNVWDEADKHVKDIVAEVGEGLACYVPPFEHPTIWNGHASMIDEIKDQLQGRVPDAICVSVGGGGLLCGVLIGLKRNGWENVHVIAVETDGANSFSAAMKEGKPVSLPGGITSIAKSLGATTVSASAVDMSLNHPGGVTSVVVSDAAAVRACCLFADDHRCLVEPACGAALAGAAYDRDGVLAGVQRIVCAREEELAKQAVDSGSGSKSEGKKKEESLHHIVVVACGGNIVSRRMLDEWSLQIKSKGD